MKKDALFRSDPFTSGRNATSSSISADHNGRAFFRQNRVSVLTKRQSNLCAMLSALTQVITYDERPAL